MKRLPLIINIILFSMLCVVVTYWGMQIFKPASRPIQAPVSVEGYQPSVGQWGDLFGQSVTAQAAPSSYQLKGVIVAVNPKDSVAIIVVEGQPNFTVGIGKELMPNVRLQEVHADHVVVSESGISRRVDLPAPTPHAGIVVATPSAPIAPAPGLVPPQVPTPAK